MAGITSPVQGFNPNAIPGLLLWLSANDKTFQDDSFLTPAQTAGTSVRGWKDRSAQHNDFIVDTGVAALKKTAGQLKNNFSLNFDTVNSSGLSGRADTTGSGMTIFISIRTTDVFDTGYYVFSSEADNVYLRIGAPSAGDVTFSAGTAVSWDGRVSTNKDYLLTIRVASGEATLWVNGTEDITQTAGVNDLTTVFLGHDISATVFSDMYIADFIVYNGAISNANLAAVNTFLINKNGFT